MWVIERLLKEGAESEDTHWEVLEDSDGRWDNYEEDEAVMGHLLAILINQGEIDGTKYNYRIVWN
jgi:hypothetical protein